MAMPVIDPCPFCGGKAKLSFADVQFCGQNFAGDKKTRYRVQVICNRCHARGKPVKTDALINCNPLASDWGGRDYFPSAKIVRQTEMIRPWAEAAIEAWNRRAE